MENEDKINRLKELIDGSASFSDSDKAKLLAKLPDLSMEEVDKAIKVFESEIEDWKEIYEDHEARKSEMKDYMQESKQELLKITQEYVRKAEKDEQTGDNAQLEDLLNTIN